MAQNKADYAGGKIARTLVNLYQNPSSAYNQKELIKEIKEKVGKSGTDNRIKETIDECVEWGLLKVEGGLYKIAK